MRYKYSINDKYNYLLFKKTIGYTIYYPHLYTLFLSSILNYQFINKKENKIQFKKQRFACLKLLNNVQSEPKLNSFRFRKKQSQYFDYIFKTSIFSYFICLMQCLLSLLTIWQQDLKFKEPNWMNFSESSSRSSTGSITIKTAFMSFCI